MKVKSRRTRRSSMLIFIDVFCPPFLPLCPRDVVDLCLSLIGQTLRHIFYSFQSIGEKRREEQDKANVFHRWNCSSALIRSICLSNIWKERLPESSLSLTSLNRSTRTQKFDESQTKFSTGQNVDDEVQLERKEDVDEWLERTTNR